ncbi:MAG: BlaI/MecI/CopY family transcriptional regulator [Acidobacteria bacterium]|nr:BlaI/MecI/CopY family transcriptional regulator [Acidobacteriota bacterium]
MAPKRGRELPRPTRSELEILKALWEDSPATVRQVHERLSRARPTGYTTVLKLMQIMAGKGLVRRDERERAHLYRPALAQSETGGRLVDELIDKAFGGSVGRLVLEALSRQPATAAEREEIRRMLNEHDEAR